jgi:hypothetical protein
MRAQALAGPAGGKETRHGDAENSAIRSRDSQNRLWAIVRDQRLYLARSPMSSVPRAGTVVCDFACATHAAEAWLAEEGLPT